MHAIHTLHGGSRQPSDHVLQSYSESSIEHETGTFHCGAPGERCSMSVEGRRVQMQASAYAIDYISNISPCIQSTEFTSIHA